MLINCDLGEGNPKIDEAIMAYIDQANIACGGHSGDVHSMRRCLALAKRHHIHVGAHPSYPDPANFGRTSMTIASETLWQSLYEQIHHLTQLAHEQDMTLSYIKPHGALYNDALDQGNIQNVLIDLCHYFELPIMTLAGPANAIFLQRLEQEKVFIFKEAFIDRQYLDNGQLMPRTQTGAVLDAHQRDVQIDQLLNNRVITEHGRTLTLATDTVCLHSDSPGAVKSAQALRHIINAN